MAAAISPTYKELLFSQKLVYANPQKNKPVEPGWNNRSVFVLLNVYKAIANKFHNYDADWQSVLHS